VRIKIVLMLIIAVTSGLLIAWIDASPGWDDAGITAGALVLLSAILGAIMPRYAALWAAAVGIWIPLWNISHHGSYSSLAVLAFAIVGAFAGAFGRRFLGGAPPKQQ